MGTNHKKSRAQPFTTGKVKTESIVFQCYRHSSQGMLLPVDVIFITRYRRLREVVSIGPNK